MPSVAFIIDRRSNTLQTIGVVQSDGTAAGLIEGATSVGGQHYHGAYVGGDQISVGNISGSQGIAIGRATRATVTTGLSGVDLDRLFQPLLAAIAAAPPALQAQATAAAVELKGELARGKQADDRRMAKLLDGLVDLVPGAVSSVVSLFASPILAGIAGPVTKFVLDRIQGR